MNAEGKSRLEKGYVQVYTGDGKGKTTAALGLTLRAMGHGLKAYVVHFMKGNIAYGELEMARRLSPGLTVRQMGRETFVSKENPDPEDVRMAQEAVALSAEVVTSGRYDVVVLDEVNVAIDFGLVPVESVLDIIRDRPKHVELLLTGRNAHPDVVAAADLVTEMKMVKHYYEKGVAARCGIEL